jgi:hypothetical protein
MEKYTLQEIRVAHLSSGWDSAEPVTNKGWRQLLQDIRRKQLICSCTICFQSMDLSAVDFTLKDDTILVKKP